MKFLGVAVGAVVVILAGAAAGCSSSGEANRGPDRRASQTTPVAAVDVRPRDLTRTVSVTGPIEPIRSIAVSAMAAGTVLRVRVQEGDRVRAGQLLAELDAREVSAQLQRAEAVLARAEADYKRAEELRARDLNSEVELEAARSAFATTRADAELWRTRLDFTRITAPAAGVITTKRVESGGGVSANEEMFVIAEDAQLVVRVQISEMDVVKLKPGRTVDVLLDAYPDARLEGRIRRIFPSADAVSRLVPVEVALERAPRGVVPRPGFLARIEFPIENRRGVMAVPTAAVGVSNGATFVYVIDADTLVVRPVETGMTAAGWVEVTSGLAGGDLVVSSGHANLRPGAAVRISEGRL
jgi:RND family efflux transporter MFP subunit